MDPRVDPRVGTLLRIPWGWGWSQPPEWIPGWTPRVRSLDWNLVKGTMDWDLGPRPLEAMTHGGIIIEVKAVIVKCPGFRFPWH